MARREHKELGPWEAAGGWGDAPTHIRVMLPKLHHTGSADPGTDLQKHNLRAGPSLDIPQGLSWALEPSGCATLHPGDQRLALLRQA